MMMVAWAKLNFLFRSRSCWPRLRRKLIRHLPGVHLKRAPMNKYYKLLQANMLYILFTVSLLATLISLSLSEVFHLVPCVLCWYQRTCMYPLPVIFGVGIYRKDRDVDLYAQLLAVVGWLIALYHTLLQWKIIPEALAPCQAGIS